MNVLHERLHALLALRTDSPALLEALDSVARVSSSGRSGLTTDNARRGLRADVERRDLDVLREFVARLEPVEERMLSLEASVRVLSEACEAARSRIERSEVDTAAFLAQAEALAGKRDALGEQLNEVTAFLAEYELAPAEAAVLAAGPQSEDSGDSFFAALARVAGIRAKSQELLTGRDQALGLELLDAATQHEVSTPTSSSVLVHAATRSSLCGATRIAPPIVIRFVGERSRSPLRVGLCHMPRRRHAQRRRDGQQQHYSRRCCSR